MHVTLRQTEFYERWRIEDVATAGELSTCVCARARARVCGRVLALFSRTV